MTRLAPAAARPDVDHPMVLAISWLLVVGVALSAGIVIGGLLLLALTGQTGYQNALTPGLVYARPAAVDFPRTLGNVVQGAVALKPFAVIELGLLLLVATPVVRVAVTILLFLWEKDYLYTGITLVVLLLLLTSIFWLR